MTIYTTNSWDGYGNNNRFWNEYRLEGSRVIKYKIHEFKTFDGKENNWITTESEKESWDIDDPDMPAWLKEYI